MDVELVGRLISTLPEDDDVLGELLDRDGVVMSRVTPEDKLRVARVLQARGHVGKSQRHLW